MHSPNSASTIIEAGFPQASDGDFASVQAIAHEVRSAAICALARCQRGDIETAARALELAARGRIHVFIATSPLHREHKLGMSRAQVIDAAVAGVRRAAELCDDVEFSRGRRDAHRTGLPGRGVQRRRRGRRDDAERA